MIKYNIIIYFSAHEMAEKTKNQAFLFFKKEA